METPPVPAGTPCWAEVDVVDLAAATAFYAAVLGWTFTEDGIAAHHELIALRGDTPVAGLGSVGATAAPAWTPFFAVDDAEDAADLVEELGGLLLHVPGDAGPTGPLFVAVDTGGSTFGGWELPGTSTPVPWVEAASAEPGPSRTFYRRLFGFTYDPVEGRGPEYTTFRGAGPVPLGAVGFAGDTLPHWLVHHAVGDVDAAVAAAGPAGGAVVEAAAPVPAGRRAVLTDPAGARFAVLQVRA